MAQRHSWGGGGRLSHLKRGEHNESAHIFIVDQDLAVEDGVLALNSVQQVRRHGLEVLVAPAVAAL